MRRPVQILLRIIGGAATLLAVILILAWIVGQIRSDRDPLSQWLAWIPMPALLPAVAIGLLSAIELPGPPRLRRAGVRIWAAAGAALLVYFCVVEHHLLRRAADPDDAVSVVNWNVAYTSTMASEPGYADSVLRLLGDVTVLVDAGGIGERDEFLARLPAGMVVANVGRVTLLSRYPIFEARQMVISDSGSVMLLRIVAGPEFTRPLTLFVVDLPSDPRRSRTLITSRLRVHLANAGAPVPDLVVGDFNIPRGSDSLARLFPGMRDAYHEGGHGYGATFHREFPLFHIDHVLLGEDVACRRYDLLDPGVGRHRVQRAYLQPRQ